MDIIKKSKASWSLSTYPQDMGMVKLWWWWWGAKRLSIAHWKALGESYLLSHKSSSGGEYEGVMAARGLMVKYVVGIQKGEHSWWLLAMNIRRD